MSSASMKTIKDTSGKVVGYTVRWRNPQGVKPRQPRRTFKKNQKQLAERFLATVQLRLTAGETGIALESPLTLEDFYTSHYLPRRERESEDKTNESRGSFWGKWIKPELGHVRVARITPMMVAALEEKILSEGFYETAIRVRSLLTSILDAALGLQIIDSSPTAGLRKVRKPAKQERWLSKDDVRRAIEATDDYTRPIVVTLALTGMRIGEAGALLVSNVNLEAGIIEIEASLSSVSKRYRTGSRTKRKATKTASGKRRIVIPEELVEAIRPLVAGRPKQEPLFTSPNGARLDMSHFRSRKWNRLREKAGLPEWATPHDLRHHVASVLFELDVNELKIAAYLGHKNSDITRRVYAHLLSEDTTEVAEALSGADLVSSVLSVDVKGGEGESQTS